VLASPHSDKWRHYMTLIPQVGPFILLLLAIALMPVLRGHFWERDRNKALVTLVVALPSVVWLLVQGLPGRHLLLHALTEYSQFILLLAALYAVSGIIVIHGDLPRGPLGNTLWLALGAILANAIGTTGASMLLVRPLLRANHHRAHKAHIPIFFIFIVSNCGGLLLPVGDPPLFLGFLQGVDFFWTLRLWPQWLLVNVGILGCFYFWDARAQRKYDSGSSESPREPRHPLRVEGLPTAMFFLLAVMATLLLQAPSLAQALGRSLRAVGIPCGDPLLTPWVAIVLLALWAALAALEVQRPRRETNNLVWTPLREVAILFAGIFLTMAPSLQLLGALPPLAWTPAGLLWTAGGLSSVLDNAPTYLAFATIAEPGGPAALSIKQPRLLEAVSCGAVWMGALTYIGNGPNFLVRGIAEHIGYRMPSFFGYLAYSITVLLPLFALATALFFW
jgi:Na+/H+ antiporter NhaD/arsenite permease-like protein